MTTPSRRPLTSLEDGCHEAADFGHHGSLSAPRHRDCSLRQRCLHLCCRRVRSSMMGSCPRRRSDKDEEEMEGTAALGGGGWRWGAVGIRHLHQPTIGYLILNPPSLPPSHPATAGNQDNDNKNYNNDRSGGARSCRCDGHQDADLGRRDCLLLVLLTTPFTTTAASAAAA